MPLAHPPLVLAAARGDLQAVTHFLASGVPVDACARWTESEEKYFYTKSWDWDADTALCAAVRNGHAAVVRALLAAGADPLKSVCNSCDDHETPRSIASAVRATWPESSQLVLGPLFEKQRAKAEAACAAHAQLDGALPSLFDLAAAALALRTAGELLDAAAAGTPTHSLAGVIKAAQTGALERGPESLSGELQGVWMRAERRRSAANAAAAECARLAALYSKGEGVEADEAQAATWLAACLHARPREACVECFSYAANAWGQGHCSQCQPYVDAHAALAALASSSGKAAAPGAPDGGSSSCAASRALAALEARRRVLHKAREEASRAAAERSRLEAAELRRQGDERFRAHRAREVERCKQYAAQRRGLARTGGCTNDRCESQDFCTYLHDGRDPDALPPRCRWFDSGTCRNGDRCWFSHLIQPSQL